MGDCSEWRYMGPVRVTEIWRQADFVSARLADLEG